MSKSATIKDNQVVKYIYWMIAMFFVFVLPLVVVNVDAFPAWQGRAIAVSSLLFFFTVAIFWYGLNPNTKMIRGGGLAEPRFDKIRPRIELGIRAAVVLFGVFFAVFNTFPLAADLVHLAKGEPPVRRAATVQSRTSALGGVLLGQSSVRLADPGQSFYIFYNWSKPLRVGESYEFVILPRSRMILDFREAHTSSSETGHLRRVG